MYNQPAWKRTKPNSASRFHPYNPPVCLKWNRHNCCDLQECSYQHVCIQWRSPLHNHPAAQGIQTKQWERAIGTKNFFVPQLQHKLGSKNAHSPNDSNSSIPPFHHHASKEPTGRIELIVQETTHTPSDSNGNINHQLSRISKQHGTIDHGDLYLRDCNRNHHTPLKDVSVTQCFM